MFKYEDEIRAAKDGYMDFTYVGHTSFQEWKKRDGGTYMASKMTLKIPSTGKEFDVLFFESGQTVFKRLVDGLVPGSFVRGFVNGQYINWKRLPAGDAVFAEPQKTTCQAVKEERQMTAHMTAAEKESKEREKRQAIAGIVQARIRSGEKLSSITAGDTPLNDDATPMETVRWIAYQAEKMVAEEDVSDIFIK